MIEIKNISMQFQDKDNGEEFSALRNVSFTIPTGSVYGFLGTNGAGKSTLMRILCGVYPASEGEVLIDGVKMGDSAEAKSKIFFVSDETIHYSNYTINELRDYYRNIYTSFSDDIFDRVIKTLDLPRDKKLSEFSKGMKRQASVAVGLAACTDYLILDEAFDGLDPAMRRLVKNVLTDEICERGATLIVSSHNLAEINDICDRAMLIYKGEVLFADDLDEIRQGFCKAQAVFKEKTPSRGELEAKGLSIMQFEQNGSVCHIIAHSGEEETLAVLKALSADVAEAVPLTLEEIFIYELEVRGYGEDVLSEN